MERPVYYIKGVVQEKNQDAGDFVGPLDLILHLLRAGFKAGNIF